MNPRTLLFSVFLVGLFSCGKAQEQAHLDIDSPFGSFVEEGFPFFTQTLDAREFGENPEPDNLTPRGIIIKIGRGYYGCFDPDLLRWSLIWKENEKGEYLKMDGMGPGSYRLPNRKAPAGQGSLPQPIGISLLPSSAIPGVGIGKKPANTDPRDRGISDDGEVGLGPIPTEIGRFTGIRLTGGRAILEYEIGEASVQEYLTATKKSVTRILEVQNPEGTPVWLRNQSEWISAIDSRVYQLPLIGSLAKNSIPGDKSPEEKRWPETVQSKIEPGTPSGTLTFDDIGLPVPNPWKRNVRFSALDFFPDGRAALCTFDGDVWLAEGLEEGSDTVTWSRFASGLHEPKTVCVVDNEIFVSGRNGITHLHDTDGNGEADFYENFSNIVPQTAETREFAMDMVATPDGGFIVAKGGQVGTTRGKMNGTIVKISPDGRSYDVIATGLRQPYIGLDPETGVLTSSDQQGHWKPATPIYRIEQDKYYGFQPAKFKENAVHPEPIAPPEIWIPHFINQSGASQVWMKGNANMGPLNGSLVHIGYNRPELFKVYLDENRKQGAIVPILSGFPSGVLKGKLHPKDGLLYVTGFEIWGTSGERISGLFRVRPTEATSWIPSRMHASKRGVLLEFEQPLSPELTSDIRRYSVDRWNYQQTHNYGSGNFKLDGEPGQEPVPVASAQLSEDGKRLFLGLVDMKPCHSLRITYRLPVADNIAVESAYFTIWELFELNLTEEGFSSNEVDLTYDPSLTSAGEVIEPTAELGKEVAVRYGCVACHATGESDIPAPLAAGDEGGAQVAVGPAWNGLWGSRREFTDASFIKNADETYLRESILDPSRRVAVGYETEKTGVGMPSYLGVLKDHEIDSVLLYIKSLGKKDKK